MEFHMDFHKIWQEQCAVWEIFNLYELRGYVASLKPAARKKLQKLLYVSS